MKIGLDGYVLTRYIPNSVTPEELKATRKRLGLTQTELAEALGVTRLTVTRWETGVHRIAEPIARLLAGLEQAAKAKKRKK